MKKLIALMLALITVIGALASCGGNKPADTTAPAVTEGASNPEGTDSSSETTTEGNTEPTVQPEDLFDTPETFKIEKKDYALNVEISRSQKSLSGSIDITKAQYLGMLISDKLGASPTLTTDYLRVEDSEKFEIIVGPTDHPETEALLKTMSYGDYAVRAVGNKIILLAFSEEGYDLAIEHFKTVINNGLNKTDKTITINTADLNKTETCHEQLSALPVYEGGKTVTPYDAGRVTATADCDQIIIGSTNKEEYTSYVSKLVSSGYTKYSSNEMGGNQFAIYTNDKYTVNVGYYKTVKETRILIEPKGALPTRAEDNKTQKVTTANIIMFGNTTETVVHGLGIIMRLEDGRFIVVDGGYSSKDHDANFISILKDQSKEYTNTPTIAAWIITHTHSDHANLLCNGYESIKNAGVVVENIILNELSTYEVNRAIDYDIAMNKPTVYEFPESDYGKENKKIIEVAAPALGANLYKAHVGQEFYISNCKIDVLFTMEGYAPNVCNTQNTTSVVTKMTFTDSASGKVSTFLSTGDASGFSMKTANTFFGDYLQSDILSVAHHGGNTWGDDNAMAEAYKKVNAACLLWPTNAKYYTDHSFTITQNAPLFKNPNYKESYLVCPLTEGVIIPMPYVTGNIITGKLY